ncbi:MAG TPA: hypothetical protein VJ385_16220 [Fibrobacteria bacterium]|nr:hypothetical protein [Fibrobacteria bacterium]
MKYGSDPQARNKRIALIAEDDDTVRNRLAGYAREVMPGEAVLPENPLTRSAMETALAETVSAGAAILDLDRPEWV